MKTTVKVISCLLALCGSLLASEAYASNSPKFSQYPAKVYKGKNAKVRLDKDTRTFRTRFRALAKTPVNFAGHYSITFVGCGTSCVFGLMFDAKSGKTSYLPSVTGCYTNNYEDFYDSEIYFKKNSKLLIMAGDVNEEGCTSNYYVRQSLCLANGRNCVSFNPFSPTLSGKGLVQF